MATENFFITLKPFLDGSNYKIWKYRMENYLDMQGVDLWECFLKGWKHPIDEDGAPLKREKWSKDQVRENGLNRKAISTLLSSISREEMSRLQHLTCAKQMWKTLENYHEGSTQVKAKKLELLLGEYENFKWLIHEDVSLMTTRFLGIIASLEALGKSYSQKEINGKILRSLPMILWQPKVTAIMESHDLSTMRSDELIGNLLLHEMTYIKAIKMEEAKVKSIALKACEEEARKETNEQEIMKLTKMVKELKSKVDAHERPSSSRKSAKGGSKATWDDEDDQEYDPRLCFMAIEEEPTHEVTLPTFLSWDGIGVESYDACLDGKNDIIVNDDDIVVDNVKNAHNDEIFSMLDELVIKCGDYNAKMLVSQNEASKAKDEMLVLTQEFQELKLQNEAQKKEILELKDTLSRFQKGKTTLDTILVAQRSPTIKHGLGYNQNASSSKGTIFVKSTLPQTSSIEVPPKLVKPIGAKKVHAQAPRPKPFLAQKAKSKKGTKPLRHGYASQYSHKWNKKTRKNSNVHAFSHAKSCVHNCACANSFKTSRAKPPQKQSFVNHRIQCFYCMKFGHINAHCHVRKVQLRLIPLNYSSINFQGPKVVWVPK